MKNQIGFFSSPSGNRIVFSLVCVALLALSIPFAARAQVTTAALRGTVVDEQGAAITGAEVRITNTETGFSRSTTTGSNGEYNFPDLPLGSYRIRAMHPGFKAAEQTGITLHVNDSLVVNVPLKIGTVNETISVEATPVAVETTNGELTGLVQASQVAELPLNGRNFMQLVTLMPGVAPAEAFSVTNKGLKGASDVSISGGPSNGNQWLVDGANNNDTGSQRTILVYPSTESIEEFKIERNSYGPEFGLSAGAQINIVTKSGANDFHGSVFYSGRNDKLNAFDTQLKAGNPNAKKNKFRGNDFGYTVGGPVKRDKIFFFWSQEWNKRIEGLVRSNRVPTLAERTGDFSAVAACPGNTNGNNNLGFPVAGLHDPAGPVGNNSLGTSVPANRQNSVGLLLMKMYPSPTLSDPCASRNWTASLNTPTPWREENVRGDINLSKSMTLMLRYVHDSWQIGPPTDFGWGNNPLGVIGESWTQPGSIAVGRLSKTIGTTAVNDFQFSFSQNKITINPADSDPKLRQQLNTQIPTFFPLSGKLYGDKGPSVWFQGTAHMPSVWTISPWANEQDLMTWQDDLSLVKGRHTFKFGASFSRNMKDEQQSNLEFGNISGVVGFNGCSGKIIAGVCPNSTGNTTGYDVSDFLLHNMSVSMGEASTIFVGKNRWRNYEFYAGDTVRLTSRLTVVYGARYSLLPNPFVADDRYVTFNPIAYNAALGNATCNGLLYSPGLKANPCPAGTGGIAGPNRALWNNNNHLIAPRLSLAWDPTGQGKWSIRAGLGQFFERDRLYPLQIEGQNPPFIGNFSSTNGRFLDSTTQPAACAPNCFSVGLGHPGVGNETTNQIPNSWQFNLTVQRELFKNARLEVGYVGNRGYHLRVRSDVNAVRPGDRLAYFQNSGDSAARSALRPFGAGVLDNSITYNTRSGQSSYNSLQTAFNMRLARNSIFQAAYTWSKLISDTQLIDSPANNVDFYNPAANRGLDQLNRPHIFTANVIYDLPTLSGQSGLVRTALGSWELSTILSFASGPSLTPIVSGDYAGVGSSGNERPMRVAGQPCRASGNDGRQWFNPNAYTMNGYAIGKFGSSGVGICTGPGNSDVDFSIRKNFRLTERFKMQFQMDFFNVFNHPQYQASAINMNWGFNSPTRTPGNPASALYADKNGNAIFPATANTTGCNGTTGLADPNGTAAETKCAMSLINTSYRSSSNFGLAGQSRENGWRQIQYGLKFTF
jgi:hypothetical protein